MDKQRLLYLLNQQGDKRLTASEYQELEAWYALLSNGSNDFAEEYPPAARSKESMLAEFRQSWLKPPAPVRTTSLSFRLIGVAALLTGVCLTIGAYFFFLTGHPQPLADRRPADQAIQKDQEPGGNKATLTLANGMRIFLDSAANGTLAVQGNATITKLANGQLTYRTEGKPVAEALYNTMSTPRGGEYELLLPDGTRVWLNSSSTIRYPTAFTGKQRSVAISGEAYFEVAHAVSAGTGKRIPFLVTMPDGEQIEVLGTHFNVNAYAEEGLVKTTLLEGSVKLTGHDKSVLILPGQQASLEEKGYHITMPDLEKVIAWKTGFFDFDNLDLAAIMRQISRWYDVDVVFDGKPHAFAFGGRISKNLPLSGVLKMFEEYNVAFRMDGKLLHVTY